VGTGQLDFAEVYELHVDRVARWVARLAGPRLDAEDLVQEVFVIVHRQLEQFRGEAKLTTWLYRITERLVRDARRTEARRRWLRSWFGGEDEEAAVPPLPLQALEQRQAAQLVYSVLDELPERDRALLIMFELEGLSGETLAELTGMPIATVWVRLHRARARFRARVDALPEEQRRAVGAPAIATAQRRGG
jgi:RNA polymerase sigma-70 factor (ECF subfamily)